LLIEQVLKKVFVHIVAGRIMQAAPVIYVKLGSFLLKNSQSYLHYTEGL
jgi:peptidoglycan biosynthesis protein MviN/MurJ (putative lipid II flippase)